MHFLCFTKFTKATTENSQHTHVLLALLYFFSCRPLYWLYSLYSLVTFTHFIHLTHLTCFILSWLLSVLFYSFLFFLSKCICFLSFFLSFSLSLTLLSPEGKREMHTGLKRKGKRINGIPALDLSLSIQTARARTHDTKRFPGQTPLPPPKLR